MRKSLALSVFAFFMVLIAFVPSAFAESMYPETLNDGDLVLVSGHMGVGQYADKTSVVVQQYAPPRYQIAINVVSVVFSEDHFRQYRTYVGSSYTISRANLMQFRYNWDNKTVSWYSGRTNSWRTWDINRDNSHADGQPLIPNTAEVAFVAAYNMRFFDDTEGYSPVLKKNRRVIDETFYERLGI